MNDPVAAKLMKRAAVLPKLEPPEDKSITTLYIGNVASFVTEKDLQYVKNLMTSFTWTKRFFNSNQSYILMIFFRRDMFYQYGEIRNITVVARQQCAFIEFVRRADAEIAAEKTFNTLILGGRRLNIKWGHTQGRRQQDDLAIMQHRDMLEPTLKPSKNLPSGLPPLPKDLQNDFFNLTQGESSIAVPPPPLPAPPLPPGFSTPIPNPTIPPMPSVLFVNNYNPPFQ